MVTRGDNPDLRVQIEPRADAAADTDTPPGGRHRRHDDDDLNDD
jgi:hypothetical protein